MSRMLSFRINDTLGEKLDRFPEISVTDIARAALEARYSQGLKTTYNLSSVNLPMPYREGS